ncbi:GNAT family N-acetyltransferase [Spirosoma pomorum]
MTNNYGFIRTEYSFTSGSGELESGRYINEYKVRIYFDEVRELSDTQREESVEIGRASVSLFLVELGLNNDQSMFDIFDHCIEYVNLYEEVYDEHGEFQKPLIDTFEPLNDNLLYIRRLELLPEWRGRGIGQKVLKDIIWRFDSCCGMVVLKAFPLQFEAGILTNTSLWTQQLMLSSFTQNTSMAQRKLFAFYKSIGFKRVPKSDLHYLSMFHTNPKLDAIALNEEDVL